MEFVFEERKGCGRGGDNATPKHAAVRLTTYARKDDARTSRRLYISFTPAAVREGKWMKGDRLVAGSDASAGLICFKRDKEYGFTLAGGSLTEDKTKSHLVANVQVSVSEDSPLWQLVRDKLGKWFSLTPQGLLMVASVLPVDTTTT